MPQTSLAPTVLQLKKELICHAPAAFHPFPMSNGKHLAEM